MEIEERSYLDEINDLTDEQIRNRIRIFEDNIRIMK
jgi:hypothetical protein